MRSESLEVDRQLSDRGTIVLRLRGVINANTFEILDGAVHDTITRGGVRIIFDMGNVEYISSAGIGVLMNAMAESQRCGGGLVLACVPENVRAVFDTMNLTSLLRISADVKSAVKQF
jgi:anti-anti-sigma factor